MGEARSLVVQYSAVLAIGATALIWFAGRSSPSRPKVPSTLHGVAEGTDGGVPGLSDDVRSHGQTQLLRMLADRPTMKLIVHPGDDIARWFAARFDGTGLKFRVNWNPAEPEAWLGNVFASSRGPVRDHPAEIRLRELPFRLPGELRPTRIGSLRTAERLCASAVFEFLNLDSWDQHAEIHRAALRGGVSRSAYVERLARLEFESSRQRITFFQEIWIPIAARRGINATPHLWGCSMDSTYEGWIKQLAAAGSEFPEVPYGTYFDRVVAPFLREKGGAKLRD